MSGSFNALARVGLPDRGFQPVVGNYGAPMPGMGQPQQEAPMPGQPLPMPMPTTPQPQPQQAAPVYSGAMPDMGYGQDAQTAQYDPSKSPNQTWGGLLDALGNAFSFAMNPVGFAAGFMGTAAMNPNATNVGQMFNAPAAADIYTGALPGTSQGPGEVWGETPNMGGVFDTGGMKDPASGPTWGDPGTMGDGVGAPEGWGGGWGNPGAGDSGFGMGETGNPDFGGAFREGGMVPGHGEVPILAHGGEYVIRPEAVQRYGRNALDMLNAGAVPRNALASYE
jgi:hypothetical protein